MKLPTIQEAKDRDFIPTPTLKMKTNQIVTDGTPKGEMIIITAESNVEKPAFPRRIYRTSSKLTDAKTVAVGECIIGILHVIIFFVTFAEWLWSLLPDKCEIEGCRRLGIRGNETEVKGILMCDYCSYLTG